MSRSKIREERFLLLYQAMFDNAPEEQLDKIAPILEYTDQADEIINKYSKTRKVGRIPRISVAIMRVALYEMECDDSVPDKVAINEAIELCKKYSGEADCKFVSGLLGSYYRDKEALL